MLARHGANIIMMKYPQGYLPKISYWSDRLEEAIKNDDQLKKDKALNSLAYFIGRQFNDKRLSEELLNASIKNIEAKIKLGC